jgi:hypothetical protein
MATRAGSRFSRSCGWRTDLYRLTVANDNQQELGESLAETLTRSVFVQVTATPYALLLRPIDHPLRPRFTRLIEPGYGYLGGDWFFPERLKFGVPPLGLSRSPTAEHRRSSGDDISLAGRRAAAYDGIGRREVQ